MKGDKSKGKSILIKLTRDIHFVDDLKANLLIGMDILGPEGIVIDFPRESIIVTRCGAA